MEINADELRLVHFALQCLNSEDVYESDIDYDKLQEFKQKVLNAVVAENEK